MTPGDMGLGAVVAAHGDGDGAPMTGAVICLHGLGRTPSDWDGVRAGLGRFGDVRAPALPIRQGEAVAFLAPMIAPGDIVVGHSMGGVVAQLLGARVELRALVVTGCFFPPACKGRGLGQRLVAGHARRCGSPSGEWRRGRRCQPWDRK